jgi:hypothetical protein
MLTVQLTSQYGYFKVPLDKQKIYVPFTEGLDQATDEKFVQNGEVTLLENGKYFKDGRINKRNGFTNLSTDIYNTGSVTDASGVYSINQELIMDSSDTIRTYSDNSNKWITRSSLERTALSDATVVKNNAEQTQYQHATSGNVRVFAWKDSRGGVRVSVQDTTTGAYYVADKVVQSGSATPRVVALSDRFVILHANSNLIRYNEILFTTPGTVSASATLVNDLNTTYPAFDCLYLSGTGLYVSYVATSTDITSNLYAGALPTVSSTRTFTAGNVAAISVTTSTVTSTTYYHIAYAIANAVRVEVEDSALTSTISNFSMSGASIANINQITGAPFNDGTHAIGWLVGYVYSATANLNYIAYSNTNSTGVTHYVIGSNTFRLASRLFMRNGNVHAALLFCAEESAKVSLFSVNRTTFAVEIVSSALPGYAAPASGVIALGTVETTGNLVTISLGQIGDYTTIDNVYRTPAGFSLASFTFGQTTQMSSAIANNVLYLAAGGLRLYDGANIIEDGFPNTPVIISAVSGGAGNIANGTYQYALIYEWVDFAGNIYRSTPSLPLEHTVTGGPKEVTVNTVGCDFTLKEPLSAINTVLYRTEINGTIFYRVASGSLTSPAVIDNVSDADLVQNEILYTVGGVIENEQAPSCNIIVNHRNRLFIAGLEQTNTVRFSKLIQYSVSPSFSSAFEIRLNPIGGQVTALASMDDKLIIFQNDYIYFITGDGPDDTGNGAFTDPQLISAVLGCQNFNSVVNLPNGLLFKSDQGIYLLTRGLELVPAGDRVKDFNQYTVTSSVVIADDTEVRMTTNDGYILTYDHKNDDWSVYTGNSAVGSTIWQGKHTLVGSNGLSKYEDATTSRDNGNFVSLKIRGNWVQLDEVAGLERIYRAVVVGSFLDAHVLNVDISYDLDATVLESHSLVIDDNPNQYEYEVRHKRQKCSSVQYTIYDSAPTPDTGEGRGLTVSGMRLLAGIKSKLQNLSKGRKL